MGIVMITRKSGKRYFTMDCHFWMKVIALLTLMMAHFSILQWTDACASNDSKGPVVYLGMILGKGGLGDRSFNDSAFEGLRDSQKR